MPFTPNAKSQPQKSGTAQGNGGGDIESERNQLLITADVSGGQRDESLEPENQPGSPTPSTVWTKYEYPDSHIFASGQKGAGNIGNGLCTQKNSDRTQVKNGYCQMLDEILNDPKSCAGRSMNLILREAGNAGFGVGDLHLYCGEYSQVQDKKQRTYVFLQVLSGLITKESGWNTNAQEPGWTKNGKLMGGKGLFQIGVSDKNKDPDCNALTDTAIFDPRTNLKCGSCIALRNLAMDATMGHGSGESGARGLGRYFGPFRDLQIAKRQDIARAVGSYCQANVRGLDVGLAPSVAGN